MAAKTTSFSWLHLTDLHCGMQDQDWLWPGVRQIFFNDLERLHEKSGPWDLVLFTGDLTQKGRAEEFKKVNRILEELWNYLKKLGSFPVFLAVPGNHDLVRPKKSASLKVLQQWGDDPDVQEEFWRKKNSSYRRVVTNAFKHYVKWWQNHPFRPQNITAGLLPGDFSVTIEKNGTKLGIVGLNSSFLQLTGDNYKGRLAIHTKQFL